MVNAIEIGAAIAFAAILVLAFVAFLDWWMNGN